MRQLIEKNIKDLIPYCNNSRTHSDEQVQQIASSIKEFGFTNPVLIDEQGGIIAGHGRVMGAKKLGLNKVPCIVLDGLSEAQKKAYIIADNKLALNAGWDDELLKVELNSIALDGFNLDLTGFNIDEISKLFDESKGVKIDDDIKELTEHSFVVKYPHEKRIEVMNILSESIKDVVGVTLWCDNEQV
jgi:ParB-like chromosome segregation protein Spo0J